MFEAQSLYDYIDKQWQENIIPSLCDYIKIPNKSPLFDPSWEAHGYMEQAVDHVSAWCEQHAPKDMSLEVIRIPGRTPLLLLEVPGELSDTVLFYGHLDKQPEMTGWQAGLGPWTPVIKKGLLYGRGAADDGYAVYAALTAIRAVQEQGLSHPRCLILIEASEESGSCDLPYYMNNLQTRLGQPALIIGLDSGAGNYDQLWITTSLRGNIVGELTVELLQEGVHSGMASGVVADSFRVARQLLSRIENEGTGEINLAELHVQIPDQRREEAATCAAVMGENFYRDLPFHRNVQPLLTNVQELILNRSWRPALTITGADGFPAITNAGNVVRPKTAFKFSMRLPPSLSPQKASAALRQALTADPPYQAKVNVEIQNESRGWEAPPMEDWLKQAADEASVIFYKKPAAYMGEGGTIPFMGMLGETFPLAQFVITGVLGPHSNAHGPNEFLHIEMAKKLTCCIAFILYQTGKEKR